MNELVGSCIKGDMRSIARLITLLENQDREAYAALYRLKDHEGVAQVVGITGPPGAGKSTLVDKLISQFRAKGKEGRRPGCRSYKPFFRRSDFRR